MLMAGKEAPSEERAPTLYELALFGSLCGKAALERYVAEVVAKVGLRPNPETATVPNMEQPSWPHPLRATETDTAQAVAESLAWYGMWLWE